MIFNPMDYCVDIVICIDTTGSMQQTVEQIKNISKTLYQKLFDSFEENGKNLDKLRVKIIAFKDYEFDDDPMIISDFFHLSCDETDQTQALVEFIENLNVGGGGDISENSLEALALAMQSDWVQMGDKQRHMILLYTDAPPKELGKCANLPLYPQGIPNSFEELYNEWENQINFRSKRLLVVAPKHETWEKMIEWNYTFFTPTDANCILSGIDEEEQLYLIKAMLGGLI